jgi:putative membrane protein
MHDDPQVRRLDRWSWLFIASGTLRALVVPAIAAIFASGGILLLRPGLLSLVVILPAALYGVLRQRIYSYRFTDDELVVRDGLLTRNVRRIPYDRIHNVALVRNPLHRALGVATARIETASGGRPEALLRVLSLEAADELRRRTLGEDAAHAGAAGEQAASGEEPLVATPDGELVRLGLISNRGLLVVAAVIGALSQVDVWHEWITDLDWEAAWASARESGPGWLSWMFDPESIASKVLAGLAIFVLLLALLRLLSVAWYLVRYRGFTLRRERDELRTEYGLLTQVSSVIPVHRVQLLTVTASLLHRWFARESIEVETAGASEEGSDLSQQLAASGVKLTRQWLAPIVPAGQPAGLIRQIMPEIDLDAVEWQPIQARAVRRIVRRVGIVVVPLTVFVMAGLSLSPIPVHGLHALWIPASALPGSWLIARRWVRSAGWALTDHAILFRSGWPGRSTSLVRFVNVQTASLKQSPFDRRSGMATLAVDTAGAGMGHKVEIPFLDAAIAARTLGRLYAEGCATEFRW